MALADIYDALISKRCYKPPLSFEDARDIILMGSATTFDPVVVDAFTDIEYKFKEIASRFSDENEGSSGKDKASPIPSQQRHEHTAPDSFRQKGAAHGRYG